MSWYRRLLTWLHLDEDEAAFAGPAVEVGEPGCGCEEVLSATGVMEVRIATGDMELVMASGSMEFFVCEDC